MAGEYEEMPDEGSVEVAGSDFFIPKDALGDKECKAGDTITLTVSTIDEDGDVGVKMSNYSHKDKSDKPADDDADLRLAFK